MVGLVSSLRDYRKGWRPRSCNILIRADGADGTLTIEVAGGELDDMRETLETSVEDNLGVEENLLDGVERATEENLVRPLA